MIGFPITKQWKIRNILDITIKGHKSTTHLNNGHKHHQHHHHHRHRHLGHHQRARDSINYIFLNKKQQPQQHKKNAIKSKNKKNKKYCKLPKNTYICIQPHALTYTDRQSNAMDIHANISCYDFKANFENFIKTKSNKVKKMGKNLYIAKSPSSCINSKKKNNT